MLASLHRALRVVPLLIVSVWLAQCALAQDPPTLTISPGKATMLVGETHTFRAVGKDGRMRHNVRWGISPEQAASLTLDGDEAVVAANEVSSSVLLTAYSEGDSATATVEIRAGETLPMGTAKWSVAELPGCKEEKIIPAVPSAGGPDIYVQESCPQGEFIRAINEEGGELWRRQISGPGAVVPSALNAKTNFAQGAHLNRHDSSICDAVSLGMTRKEVLKLIESRSLALDEKQRASDEWALEEEGSRCTISFDGKSAAVVKKKKTIVTD